MTAYVPRECAHEVTHATVPTPTVMSLVVSVDLLRPKSHTCAQRVTRHVSNATPSGRRRTSKDLGVAVAVQKNVLGLEVAVHHGWAPGVQILDGGGDLSQQIRAA